MTRRREPSRARAPARPFRYGPRHARARRPPLHAPTTSGPGSADGTGAGRHHRLRPGRARRRRLRRPTRRSAPASTSGGVLGEVESTKSVSEIYAPVAGEVVAVNTRSGRRSRAPQHRPLRGRVDQRDRPRRRRDALDALLDAARYTALDLRVVLDVGRTRGDGLAWTACSATTAGIATRPTPISARRAARVLDRAAVGHHRHAAPGRRPGRGRRRGAQRDAARPPERRRAPGGEAGPERRHPLRSRDRCHPGRPPPRERHLPRRHHRVAPPRRVHQEPRRATPCATWARSTAPT